MLGESEKNKKSREGFSERERERDRDKDRDRDRHGDKNIDRQRGWDTHIFFDGMASGGLYSFNLHHSLQS